MKPGISLLGAAVGLLITVNGAFADLPEPKAEEQNPDIAAGRKAIEGKNYKSAIEHLTRAVKKSPDNADVHNMLGYSYRKTNNLDRAMEHYRTALKLEPNHRGAHEYLGELYLDLDQPANAEKQLQALKRACPLLGRCPEYDDLKQEIDRYKAKK